MKKSIIDKKDLLPLARYVWWEKPDYVVENNPLRVVAAAMNDANDLRSFLEVDGLDSRLLKLALSNAQAGWFNAKSWSFWHYRLFGVNATIPPLPKRGFLQ